MVEEYDDGYWSVFRELERAALDELAGGRPHLHEAAMKEDRGPPPPRRPPGASHPRRHRGCLEQWARPTAEGASRLAEVLRALAGEEVRDERGECRRASQLGVGLDELPSAMRASTGDDLVRITSG